MASQNKFYCNLQALDPVERSKHRQLTERLIKIRKRMSETKYGYEFQFDSADISVGELANWVVAEGKCCPFFDFHIDVEHAGRLVCLRLTGASGIKPFIVSEFHISTH